MFRESLCPDCGMLFVFPRQERYAFWMKNMRFPLDFIWIGEDKKVSAIITDVPPCSGDYCPTVASGEKVKYVLEVNAGFAAKHNIKVSDKVKFK